MADHYGRDRRDFSSSDNYRGGGGGRGYPPRGGGRGGHRGGGYRGGGGRGRGGFRGRGGPRRRPGNRFAAESTRDLDPQAALRQNLMTMLNQIGTVPEDQNRIETQADNIAGLTRVLTGDNIGVFLEYNAASEQAEQRAGPLAAGLAAAVGVWPLQAPVYACLTLAVEVYARAEDRPGFGSRCLTAATTCLARDLDHLLLGRPIVSTAGTTQSALSHRAHATSRVRLTLRYLATLTRLGMIVRDDMDESPVPAATNHQPMTMAGLLQAMVQAAVQAHERHGNAAAAVVLALLVLDSLPALLHVLETAWILENLVQPLEPLLAAYQSKFAPGTGALAILLQSEQHEEVGQDEEDEDDDDDDEEEESSGQVCDSLQDLVRSVKHLLEHPASSKFAIFQDAPWKFLYAPSSKTNGGDATMQVGEDGETETPAEPTESTVPLAYTQEGQKLSIFPHCESLTFLLGGEVSSSISELGRVSLDGLIYGRLPIFGPPPEVDDDEQEADEEMEAESSNERLDAYRKDFGLVDRYFFGEAVRDIVLSSESVVTDAGVERGTSKAVAEQVWSMMQLVEGVGKGLEYAIIEAIFSLIVQSSALAPNSLVYLSRVLLELTKLAPNLVSPAIALAVGNLFQDYMSAMVPQARHNLSLWFAFHMTNTDYQWPAAYWKVWEPFVLHGWGNSRGAFVRGALAMMLENASGPEVVVTDCLPKESALSDHLVSTAPASPFATDNDEDPLPALEKLILRRIWDDCEDATMLLSYLTGEEVSESVSTALEFESATAVRSWWRTFLVVRALLEPAIVERNKMVQAVETARNQDGEGMVEMDEGDDAQDSLAKILDNLKLYQPLLVGVLEKDTEQNGEEAVNGQLFLLSQLESITAYSRGVMNACIHCLIQNDIVAPDAVFRWCLGESDSQVILRWWEIASSVVEFAAGTATKSSMDVDDGGPDEDQAAAIINQLDPLLSYMVRQVSTLLPRKESGSKKLLPSQVDLIEGVKVVALRARVMVDNDGKLAQSAIAGPTLATLCDSGSHPAVDLLQRVLQGV